MHRLNEKYKDRISLVVTGEGPMKAELEKTMPENVVLQGTRRGMNWQRSMHPVISSLFRLLSRRSGMLFWKRSHQGCRLLEWLKVASKGSSLTVRPGIWLNQGIS